MLKCKFSDCSQVPQYYYSVCDDDFQLLLDRLAFGSGGGGVSRSMPPTPAVGFSGRSTSPWCGRHHRRHHHHQRHHVPLAVVVDGSSLDQLRQSSSSSTSSTSSARCVGAICRNDDAAAWRAGLDGGALARCRSEPDLLTNAVNAVGQVVGVGVTSSYAPVANGVWGTARTTSDVNVDKWNWSCRGQYQNYFGHHLSSMSSVNQ